MKMLIFAPKENETNLHVMKKFQSVNRKRTYVLKKQVMIMTVGNKS
ncbi:hypothetical protein [Bacteroides sp.]|nr:hypothetical protein [Bacteroides sp.]